MENLNIQLKEPLYDILKRRELNKNEWQELKSYADKKGIQDDNSLL